MEVQEEVSGWNDPLLSEVTALLPVIEESPISFIQRKFKIGYNRATRLHQAATCEFLKTALSVSWCSAVDLYEQGVVNNERTLHAILFSEIRARTSSLTVMCEPHLTGYGKPDLVVLCGPQVVGLVEVKVRKHPVFQGDVEKMRRLLSTSASLDIKVDPVETGRWPRLTCTVSPYCLAAFAVIGRDDAVAVSEDAVLPSEPDPLRRNFVLMSHSAIKVGRLHENG